MTHKDLKVVACLLLAFGVFPLGALAQTPRASACDVTVTTPNTGDRAGADVLVSGKATVPAGNALWAFAHRKGLAVWWPQGGGAVLKSGEYSVLVTLGVPQDVGAEFEIVVQVVDSAESARLDAWFKRADATGAYPGIMLPAFVTGCGAPPRITVVKTR